jgi:UDP-N-acetylmuramoyl-tripeptide--D-alanyl-D-alanine ligase
MRWTLLQISEPMLAVLGSGLNALARVAGVSIDSRTIRTGELFIAIHGPRHDGHDHVAAALERGALAAVVAESRASHLPDTLRGSCLVVDDTLRALHRLATAVNAYGLPLTLFRLEEEHDAAVLEMGMSRRHELQELAAIAKPDVGVVTRVAPAHLEFFASVEEIALAKRELIEGLNGRDSVAVLNADDPLVAAFASSAPGRVLTYGIDNAADYRAEAIEDRGALGSVFVLVENGRRARLELALPGRHVICNTLGALAAASVWGIGAAEAQSVFRTLHAPAMRGELLRFSNGAALINDSYNSSPAALHAMIKVLAATPGYRRRILAAGEMRELGATSSQLHREAGKFAAQTGKIDWVVSVEGDAEQIVEGAVAAGVPRSQTKVFASSEDAAKFLADFVAPGDLLLVKGSRGVKMERIVESLLAVHAPELAGTEKVRH